MPPDDPTRLERRCLALLPDASHIECVTFRLCVQRGMTEDAAIRWLAAERARLQARKQPGRRDFEPTEERCSPPNRPSTL